jgi:hypothetical protein
MPMVLGLNQEQEAPFGKRRRKVEYREDGRKVVGVNAIRIRPDR